MKIFETIKSTSRLSMYSPLYVLICGAVTFFCWMTGRSLLGMVILMLIASVVLIISHDILPILPCLLYIILNTSSDDILNQEKTWPVMMVLGILLVGSFISHMISYPIKFKNYKLTIPLVALSIALFLGGIGYLSFGQYLKGVVFILSLGPCTLIIYYLVMAYANPPEGVDTKKYICMIMLVLGLIMISQITTYILRSDKPLSELLRADIMNIGWTNRNGLASLMIVSAPCCFYLAYKNKYFAWLYYSIGLIIYAFVFISFCRSAMLASLIAIPALVIYSFVRGNNRSQLVIVLCVMAIFVSIIALLRTSQIVEIINKISNITFTSSGRLELYSEALNCFIKNPVFGVGMGYVGKNWDVPDFCVYWFHCSFLQVIASMGIVGIIAYGYFYFIRGKIMFKNLKNFNVTASLGILSFEFHCLMNPETFIPFPFMLVIIVLTAVIELNNNKDSHAFMKSINLDNRF